jgi:hypothetical protein
MRTLTTARKSGWALKHGDRFWGDTSYSSNEWSHGWTDNISKVLISCTDKPAQKTWFESANYGYKEVELGEWVQVEIVTTHTLKEI